ncbi:MAG: UvrD-helicase domain-containing protein [Chitinivibrionales bacterium]|nr:UvrD-helicase domain-containing protein [Chitinivibrionales bacterium]
MTSKATDKGLFNSVVLNEVQKSIVEYTDSPQLVFAGAGTGKTRVLTAKIAYLIKQRSRAPASIFAATFTNKAAREMLQRVETLVGFSCSGLWIGTFHSLCCRILRHEAAALGYASAFTIYDTDDQLSLVKRIMKTLAIEERTITPKALLHTISRFKNSPRQTPQQTAEPVSVSFFDREINAAIVAYQKELRQNQAMDFDDLLLNVVELLESQPEVAKKYQQMFSYLLVDEYQDTNHAQFKIVKLLKSPTSGVFAVGDDDQSIYSWRGATIDNILSFETSFPNARIHKLEQNYRSTQKILDFANALIEPNKQRVAKKLWTTQKSTKEVVVSCYRDDRQEAERVVEKITGLLKQGVECGEIAILFRTNAQSRQFEESLRSRNIAYCVVGGMSFYERREIKDCLAYLRLLVNPKDSAAFERIVNVPPRGIGQKTYDKLLTGAHSKGKTAFEMTVSHQFGDVADRGMKGLEELYNVFSQLQKSLTAGKKPAELLTEMLGLSGYSDMLDNDSSEESLGRTENINELLNALVQWSRTNPDKGLVEYLEQVSLVADIDGWNRSGGVVNLMTLHTAKGLEFKAVFVVGCEEGILPSRQNFDDALKIEEECRLLYVGATRAREILECSYTNKRMRFGSSVPMQPSRFLEAIPPSVYQFADAGALLYESAGAGQVSSLSTDKKEPVKRQERIKKGITITNSDLSQDTVQFRIGQIVVHAKYGKGKITAISGFGPDIQLTILFNDGSRKRLMAKFANLQTS